MAAVHLLVGPDAGRGRAGGAREAVIGVLRAEGCEVVDLTGSDTHASARAAADAVAAGADRLVVVGGDGLVHLGLQAVAGTRTTLGVVPVGTGNDFTRGLDGFAADPAEAARAALGEPVALDAIRVGERWIASVATAGFSADVNERANGLRFPRGASRYTIATILELPGLRTRRFSLVVDGTRHDFDCTLLAVGNTAWFGGGMKICPSADPTDGLLDVTIVGPIGRVELLRFFRLVFDGRHLTHPAVEVLRGRSVEITGESTRMWGDGEPVGSTPVTLEAVRGALFLAGLR